MIHQSANMNQSNGKAKAWRTRGSAHDPKHLLLEQTHLSLLMMELIMTVYRNILSDHLQNSASNLIRSKMTGIH